MPELKKMLAEQSTLVRLDEERAVAAIPQLLPRDAQRRQACLDALHDVIETRTLSEPTKRRLERIDGLFAENSEQPRRSANA
jgi:hypothetical protein